MEDITIFADGIHIENKVAFRVVNPPWFVLLLVGYQLNEERMEPVNVIAILHFNLFRSLSSYGYEVNSLRPIISGL